MADANVLLDEEDQHYLLYAYSITSDGYVAISRDKKKVLLHRWLLKAEAGQAIDHINGNKLDNRKENLRFCTQAQNCANRRKRTDKVTSSKYKGVSYCKQTKRWKATVRQTGISQTLGRFSTEEAAALAYNKAALQYFGEFAHLNQI